MRQKLSQILYLKFHVFLQKNISKTIHQHLMTKLHQERELTWRINDNLRHSFKLEMWNQNN